MRSVAACILQGANSAPPMRPRADAAHQHGNPPAPPHKGARRGGAPPSSSTASGSVVDFCEEEPLAAVSASLEHVVAYRSVTIATIAASACLGHGLVAVPDAFGAGLCSSVLLLGRVLSVAPKQARSGATTYLLAISDSTGLAIAEYQSKDACSPSGLGGEGTDEGDAPAADPSNPDAAGDEGATAPAALHDRCGERIDVGTFVSVAGRVRTVRQALHAPVITAANVSVVVDSDALTFHLLQCMLRSRDPNPPRPRD